MSELPDLLPASAVTALMYPARKLLPTPSLHWVSLHSCTPRHPAARGGFDELLAAPAGDDAAAPTATLVRSSAAYESRDDRFLLKSRDYDRQYAQLYFYRLQQMRGALEAAARRAWPGVPGACTPLHAACPPPAARPPACTALATPARLFASLSWLLACHSCCLTLAWSPGPCLFSFPPWLAVVRILSVPEDGEVAVVGTLYKEMKLKPSILDE